MDNGYYWIKNIRTRAIAIVEVTGEQRIYFCGDNRAYMNVDLPEYEFIGKVKQPNFEFKKQLEDHFANDPSGIF